MNFKINNYSDLSVTKILIAINVLIFAVMLLSGPIVQEQILNKFSCSGIIPFDWSDLRKGAHDIFESGEYYRFLTANFLHFGPMHLIMNMLGLYILGEPTEHILGKKKFIILYFVCSLGTTLFTASIDIWNNPLLIKSMAGASGAVLGIGGCLAGIALYRKINNIYYMFQIDYKPLLIMLGLNILIGLVPGISLLGHLGGILTGLAMGFFYGFLIEKNKSS